MTAVIASLVYDADVVRRGRRRESREMFRHDVPVEIREIERAALTPAVRIDDGKFLSRHLLEFDWNVDPILLAGLTAAAAQHNVGAMGGTDDHDAKAERCASSISTSRVTGRCNPSIM